MHISCKTNLLQFQKKIEIPIILFIKIVDGDNCIVAFQTLLIKVT